MSERGAGAAGASGRENEAMLDIEGDEEGLSRRGMPRRDFLRAGALGLAGLAAPAGLVHRAWSQTAEAPAPAAAGEARKGGTAKAVIQIWLGGGPSHLDTFDPKPAAGEDYCGPLRRAIATNVPGIQIGELLPLLAKQADKYSIIRSMTHPSNGHEVATYTMQTGTLPSSELVYPSVGAVVALKKTESGEYKGSLPPYVTVTAPLGRFSEPGFLGPAHSPFATGGDPNAKDFRVGGILPPPGMTEERIEERRALLAALDGYARAMKAEERFREMDAFQEKAYGLILGDARKTFDLTEEKDDVRQLYGRNRFGQSCLLARRLVEGGVVFVTVNWGGWDTHKQHFEKMREMLPLLDKGLSALLEDLAQRGLLESTIVVCCGEFGRTPKIFTEAPWNGGRHHFSSVFSALVAGGGFQGGKVVGSSDFRGERVKDRPVYPWDLSASMYKLLGIDPAGKLPHPHGCVAHVTPVASGDVPSGGLLKEIM